MEKSLDFSHQEFVFGEDSISSMFEEHILICGMTDLGAEIAKNLVLSGIKHITIQDNEKISSQDIETNILVKLGNGQIGENRALVCCEKLKMMNLNVNIQAEINDLQNLESLLHYQLIILCDRNLPLQTTINNFCVSQNPPIKFISANIYGILCSIFCDLRFINESSNIEESTGRKETIEKQIWNPRLVKDDSGKQKQEILHLGLICIYKFEENFGRLPDVGSEQDYDAIINLAENLKEKFSILQIDDNFFKLLSHASKMCIPLLSTFLGGLVSQEVLKAITKKFNHLNQWIHFCTPEIVNNISFGSKTTSTICIDETVLQKLKNIRLLMLGCGSIGCEILKNLAFLNASTEQGEVVISDDDNIGKVHLTRQFLFSSQDINLPKSIVASKEILKINPKMKVNPNVNKLSIETENIYDDNFFKRQDIIIANVDNVSTRRYLDKYCVRNEKPWIDTGSMGFYGHVQVILPHLTENYSVVSDYTDNEYPYCTIKSFPTQIEHTIHWAYEKFYNLFIVKSSCFNEVWKKNGGLSGVIQMLESGGKVPKLSRAIKMLLLRPRCWRDCIAFARIKFEKYFSHKAQQLLYLFPLDYISEGKPFWQYPKCAPMPLKFEWKHELHRMFIISTAKLYASMWNVSYDERDLQVENICEILNSIEIQEFKPNPGKRVITSEDEKPIAVDLEEESESAFLLILKKEREMLHSDSLKSFPLKFNKYDETEGQMDFIYAASNLRSLMYNIETESYLKVRFIAGKIIPSLPSTNAVIAALAVLELLKILKNLEKSHYSNYFINLSEPTILISEPAPPTICKLRKDLTYTYWDHWTINEQKEETVQQFIDNFKAKFNLEPTMIVNGCKILWLSLMPSYEERKSKTMRSLINPPDHLKYVELSVSTYDENGEEEMAPSILYHFQK